MQKIIELEGPPNEQAKGTLANLYQTIFGSTVSVEMQERLEFNQDILLLFVVNVNNEAIGFKIGYRDDPETYYSWLGGVLPQYRGQGIAARLMERQHVWCAARGYKYIRTKTMNQWRSMLLLNIKMGFDVIGTQTGRNGVVKIILEKGL